MSLSFSRSTRFWFKSVVGSAVIAVAIAGCSGKEIDESNPKDLFEEAEDDIDSDRYIMALDRLRVVKNKFPYSKFSILAQLRIADVYFLQENFVEAAAAYELFRDLHPNHNKVPYSVFRVGESYYQDIPSTIARDLSSAFRALEGFEEFVRRYPNDKQTPEAKKRVGEVRETLAEKELYIADFYFKRDFFVSAKGRYEKLLRLYPESEAAKTATEKLKEANARISHQASKQKDEK